MRLLDCLHFLQNSHSKWSFISCGGIGFLLGRTVCLILPKVALLQFAITMIFTIGALVYKRYLNSLNRQEPTVAPQPKPKPQPQPLVLREVKPGDPIPNEFHCPITGEIMEDPVNMEDGRSYERWAIQKWYDSGKRTCPMNPAAVLKNPAARGTDQLLKQIIEYHLFHSQQPATQ